MSNEVAKVITSAPKDAVDVDALEDQALEQAIVQFDGTAASSAAVAATAIVPPPNKTAKVA